MALVARNTQDDFDRKQNVLELEWIKKHLKQLDINPQIDEIQSILHFALLWNLFEGKVCGTHANADKFARVVNRISIEGKLRFGNFESELGYFKSRYITNGKANDKFYRLRFRPSDRESFVLSVLESSFNNLENRVDEVVLALMIIVYRLRNNFFHGIKSLERVHTQAENFQIANKFLMHIIDLAI